jgi:hypothetical protein
MILLELDLTRSPFLSLFCGLQQPAERERKRVTILFLRGLVGWDFDPSFELGSWAAS